MIFIIDSNKIIAECISKACNGEIRIFTNAIDAMNEIINGNLPKLIFLEILLDGPDGFTFLNELISYPDTASIPVVIISSLKFTERDLQSYNVAGVLNKDTMVPLEIYRYVKKYAK